MATGPNKNIQFPLPHYDRLCFLKNVVTNPNITVGDYTYYDDFEDVGNFEKNVKYLFDFTGDKLIIGKFCMIASDVKFIMNGANHLTDAISTYPFAIFGNGWEGAMEGKSYPHKGDIVPSIERDGCLQILHMFRLSFHLSRQIILLHNAKRQTLFSRE